MKDDKMYISAKRKMDQTYLCTLLWVPFLRYSCIQTIVLNDRTLCVIWSTNGRLASRRQMWLDSDSQVLGYHCEDGPELCDSSVRTK